MSTLKMKSNIRKQVDNLPRGTKGVIQADAVTISGLTGFGLAYIIAKTVPMALNLPVLFSACTAIPMLALELLVYRAYCQPSTGLDFTRRPRPLNWFQSGTKFLGFCATVTLLSFTYWLLPEYSTSYFQSFRQTALPFFPWIVAAAVPYLILMDGRLVNPQDGCLEVGRLFSGQWKQLDWALLSEHARMWAVKFFFLPIMVVFATNLLYRLISASLDISFFPSLFVFFTTIFFAVDVIFGTVGYLSSFRTLNTHVRSVEPTVLGWLVTLVCYPPFNHQLETTLFIHSDENNWQQLLRNWRLGYVAIGFAILVFEGVYCWATVSFGLRFSNLTNRGIVITGPYRYFKHPAYLAKNIVWWLSGLPFLISDTTIAIRTCTGLLMISGIYYSRARTEERHLMLDPSFRLYSRWVQRFGAIAQIRQLWIDLFLFQKKGQSC